MYQNEVKRLIDVLTEGIRTRGNDATLEELLGLNDVANGALADILGAFTNAENLKTLLGNLDSTTPRRLGNILGALDETNTLKAILGGYTAAAPLKTTVDAIETDTEKIYDVTLGPDPVAGTLGSFIAGGGTALGTGLGASRSIVDALGHTGLAFLATGLGSNFGDFQSRTNLKTLLDVLGIPDDANGSLYTRLGAYTSGAPLKTSIDVLLTGLYDGAIKNVMMNRDMPYLTEFFETEQLNPNKWETVIDGLGTEVFAVDDGYMFYDMDTGVVLNDDVLLNSKYRWQCRPTTFSDTNSCIEQLVLEFEARVTGVLANIVEANFVMGFGETKDNDNTDNNIAVFTLDGSGNLIARTDDDGAADQDSGTIAATLTDWNKFRIEVYATGYKFYVNEVLAATNETAVPDEAMYILFGTRSDSVGAVGLHTTNIRAFYEEVV